MRHPEGLNRLCREVIYLDGDDNGVMVDAWGVATPIEELERRIAPDDQSTADFLE